MHIEQGTLAREGKALTNFGEQLPGPQSDLARESLKDPYQSDFLTVGSEAHEREIEAALVQHITQFLLELGAGFAFVGRQVHLEVGAPKDAPPSACCSAKAKLASSPSTPFETPTSPWASPNTDSSKLYPRTWKPICPASSKLSVS